MPVLAHHEGQASPPPSLAVGSADSVSSSQTGLMVFIVVALVIGFLAWTRKGKK